MGSDESRMKFSSRVLREVSGVCVVLSTVLIALTCCSMKLLDLGYSGDDVMWSICYFCINLARSSDRKGGSIVSEHVLGGICIAR